MVPIFVFLTLENINKQKENMILLLLEKGAALIRSFEAGTRTGMMGMMGMHGTNFQLQKLLTETTQQPDILYIIVTDEEGTILAHNDSGEIGRSYGTNLDLARIAKAEEVEWRQVLGAGGAVTFEVFRQFSPARPPFERFRGRGMGKGWRQPLYTKRDQNPESQKIIFVGLDMGSIEAARQEDTHHTILMAVILLLIGFAGVVSLFLAQAYRSARTSLTRIKAFSDTVVENMPIGLVAIDSGGKIASFNQAAEAVLQRSSREMLGYEAKEMLPRQLYSLFNEARGEKDVIERELECDFDEGKSIPLEVGISSLQGEDGTFLGNVILFRDLTEVQDLKREIERSQRLASLGKLAAGIAHEIRNPLSSIKGFATYFGERYKQVPEDHKTAEIMVHEVERLNRVIGQLLEFARPMEIQTKNTPIHTVIQNSLKMIEKDAEQKGISIQTRLSTEITQVSLDPDRINQVLLNLYLNAIEAMGHGGILGIELSQDEKSGKIKVAVSDTGVGINSEDLDHVFDPYFTTKQSGTGLGLAIVHKIIESHRGEVRLESEPGKGTTVTILLPDF